jgi:ATP-dependent DNA ligase
MTAIEILSQLEATPGSLAKIEILKDNKDHPQLRELLGMVFDFKIKFFMNKFDDNQCGLLGNGVSHNDFIALANKLRRRVIVGNEARSQVSQFFWCCSSNEERKWYSKILRKNLGIGVDVSMANKAGYDIEVFDVMLAKDGKGNKKVKEIVAKGGLVSPKLDGYRCLAIIVDGEVELYSRNGTLYGNFPSIEEELKKLFPIGSYVFDGEIMSDNFQSMQKTAFSIKSKQSCGDVVYHIFDEIPFDEWNTQVFAVNKVDRYKQLCTTFNTIVSSRLQLVPQTFTTSLADILQLEIDYCAQGYEGAMFVPDIPYYLGKKTNRMMKFKTMLSQDCKVLGFVQGENKYAGMLGALTVMQENQCICDVGTGFDDADRAYIWDNPDEFLGLIVECKYQELSPDGVMRFPVKMRFRIDKV